MKRIVWLSLLLALLLAFCSVPALCEEFLFRGCILSNLLPYGKTTAILASAVLFSMICVCKKRKKV